jgi:hypothetical protein
MNLILRLRIKFIFKILKLLLLNYLLGKIFNLRLFILISQLFIIFLLLFLNDNIIIYLEILVD